MEFSSTVFLFLFLPVFLLLFFLTRKTARNLFLLFASLLFYAWGEGGYILVLLFSIIVNRILGSLIDRHEAGAFKKVVFSAAVVFNLGLLFYFKYTVFLLRVLGISGAAKTIHLPLGISFFTFQALSYLIDIYRKTAVQEKNPLNFALYMAFFPKIASGPITPYRDLSRQFSVPELMPSDLRLGIQRFIIGLGKKILIADSAARIANPIFALPAEQLTAALSWLGIISFALQIYFDFSGYTDMAVGIGRICGLRLPENFNYPYFSKSIKEFWTRWHISLAQWLRDYLFLPIAYSMLRRIKKDRLLRVKAEEWSYYSGTFFTLLICGIWHGANWTFVVWGAFYGILLIGEHAGLGKFMKKRNPLIRLVYCQLMVLIAWVVFRSATLSYALQYLQALSGFGRGSGDLFYPALYLDAELLFFMAIGMIFSFPIVPAMKKWLETQNGDLPRRRKRMKLLVLDPGLLILTNLYLIAVLLISIVFMVAGSYHPFIYSWF
jgi:alginate O-acetyltransferase complex protein AlgI